MMKPRKDYQPMLGRVMALADGTRNILQIAKEMGMSAAMVAYASWALRLQGKEPKLTSSKPTRLGHGDLGRAIAGFASEADGTKTVAQIAKELGVGHPTTRVAAVILRMAGIEAKTSQNDLKKNRAREALLSGECVEAVMEMTGLALSTVKLRESELRAEGKLPTKETFKASVLRLSLEGKNSRQIAEEMGAPLTDVQVARSRLRTQGKLGRPVTPGPSVEKARAVAAMANGGSSRQQIAEALGMSRAKVTFYAGVARSAGLMTFRIRSSTHQRHSCTKCGKPGHNRATCFEV